MKQGGRTFEVLVLRVVVDKAEVRCKDRPERHRGVFYKRIQVEVARLHQPSVEPPRLFVDIVENRDMLRTIVG